MLSSDAPFNINITVNQIDGTAKGKSQNVDVCTCNDLNYDLNKA